MELTKSNKGREKLCYQGYLYTKRRTSKSHIRWICSEGGTHDCSGSLYTDLKMKSVLSTTSHTHPGDTCKVEALKARVAMKELAISKMETSASEIVDDVLELTSQDVRAVALGQVDSLKRALRRQRQRVADKSSRTKTTVLSNVEHLPVKVAVVFKKPVHSNEPVLAPSGTSPAITAVPPVDSASESPLIALTPAEKYNRTKQICISLAFLASQASIISFVRRYSLLEELQEAWKVNRDVQLAQTVDPEYSDPGLDDGIHYDEIPEQNTETVSCDVQCPVTASCDVECLGTVSCADAQFFDSVADTTYVSEAVILEDDVIIENDEVILQDDDEKFSNLLLSAKLELVSEDDDTATEICDVSNVINDDDNVADVKPSTDTIALRFSCHMCEAVFSRSRSLMSHIRRHNQFECAQCNKRVSSEKRLHQHERTHTNQLNADGTKQRFQCELCQRSLCDRRALATHMRSHFGERPYVCSTCGRAFGAPHTLRLHMRLHTGVRPHQCPFCKKTFVQSSSLLRHKRTHTGEKHWACELCHREFCDQSALIRHRNRFHPGLFTKSFRGPRPASDTKAKSFVCTLCNKSMKYQRSLDDHMNIHTNDRPYKCEQCPQAFHDHSSLRKHVIRHSGTMDYVCNICGNAFAFGAALTSHMRSHSDARPYTCEVCAKTFKCRAGLRVHTRMHTGERPFGCETCGSFFRDQATMIRHRHTHTGYRPHICAKCGKGFKDTSALAMHMRIHTGDRPCLCSLCPMKFAMKSTLKKHMRCMHTCAVCDERMPTDVLKEHRSAHSADGEFRGQFGGGNGETELEEDYVEQVIEGVEDDIKHVSHLIHVITPEDKQLHVENTSNE